MKKNVTKTKDRLKTDAAKKKKSLRRERKKRSGSPKGTNSKYQPH